MSPREVDIRQGAVHWYGFGTSRGSEPGGSHPALVIQGDAFNRSAWRTTVLAVISSNMGLMRVHGMVFLSKE
jgi:mRNA interferase MazF